METLERHNENAGTGQKQSVLVVGGGLAGLTAAKYLSE